MQLSQDTKRIVAGKLFDPYTLGFLEDQVITVSEKTGLIRDVRPLSQISLNLASPHVIDLRGATVLPGFVDTHVHLFLHPYAEVSWDDQLTKEPLVERTIRATNHARATLLAGFTTVRDLGTEGAEDADIALRKCLSGPDALIPGPRYFTANRAIVPTGSYGPKGTLRLNEEGVQGITGAEVADGVDGCRTAVRRQIGAGADWIKVPVPSVSVLASMLADDVYTSLADYRVRSRLAGIAVKQAKASISTFQDDELKTLIDTAHFYGVKIAAHATTEDAISKLVDLGVDSIEHGYGIQSEDLFDRMVKKGTTWVPTLAAYYTMGATRGDPDTWERAKIAFGSAVRKGVRIACGGDTGVFAHGENALELQLMVRLGADWRHVLRWATLGGWECVRSSAWDVNSAEGAARIKAIGQMREGRETVGDNEMPFGVVRKGFAADLIATTGDLDCDFERAVSPESISFVMKMGKVYKRDGLPVLY